MFGRKGQGAMEYLMTYGWAILVVMIVGIVMWQLGIFNPSGTQATTMQGFGAVKPQLAGTGLKATGTFTGTFLNAGGAPIKLDMIQVTMLDPATGPVSSRTDDGGTAWSAQGTYMATANEHVVVTIGGIGTIGEVGEAYSAEVVIEYIVDVGGAIVTKKSSGIIRGPLE